VIILEFAYSAPPLPLLSLDPAANPQPSAHHMFLLLFRNRLCLNRSNLLSFNLLLDDLGCGPRPLTPVAELRQGFPLTRK
jgi:hypothetical protein